MMKAKGFTLIELAVVLAIIAVLAAILTPLVSGYLDQARIARAQADVRTIADAIKLHQRDTGRYPIYASAANYPATIAGGGTNGLIAGPGTDPTNLGTWASGVTIAASTLEQYINGNAMGLAANAFPKAGFRGPYVASITDDPWGYKYVLTAAHLGSATNHAYVVSGGANNSIETAYTQAATAAISVGTDDIVAVIK
jgi:general secretion pathway protein G